MEPEGPEQPEDAVERVRTIAKSAIESINELTRLVNQNDTSRRLSIASAAAPGPSHNNRPSSSLSSSAGSVPSCSTSGRNSAISELHRRFPTAGANRNNHHGTRPVNPFRYQPYTASRPGSRRAGPGRPIGLDFVSKDVIILEKDTQKVPSKTEKQYLERNKRIISGFDINRQWHDLKLFQELQSLVPKDHIGVAMDFEIVKNSGGAIVKPNLPPNKRVDSKLLLRSIAPTGAVYLRLLDDITSDDDDDDFLLELPVFGVKKKEKTPVVIEVNEKESPPLVTVKSPENEHYEKPVIQLSDGEEPKQDENNLSMKEAVFEPTCPFDIKSIIDKAKTKNLTDPVEILRFLQETVVQGRALELNSVDEVIADGPTNFITVDRERILESTFSELEFVIDQRLTYQVDFMGEESVDNGGPRKEWIILANRAIKTKYFEHGLRPLLSPDYYYVGIMFAVAILQNGQMPAYCDEAVLQQILKSSADPCIQNMQKGMEKLGILSSVRSFPVLLHLLRPSPAHQLSVQSLLHLLKPNFSDAGSNALVKEKEVYQLFVRYVREVAGGRRICGNLTLSLGNILQFSTGTTEEPILGFQIHPSIEFTIPQEANSFTPCAHTCINALSLPRATLGSPLPDMERLFGIYDLAFANSYFGIQ